MPSLRQVQIFAIFALLCGCSTVLPTFTPLGGVENENFDSTISTAVDGDILHQQRLVTQRFATLDEHVEIRSHSGAKPHLEIERGALLQPGSIVAKEGSGVGFCAIEYSVDMRNLFGGRMVGRACFLDVDGSGSFDYIYSATDIGGKDLKAARSGEEWAAEKFALRKAFLRPLPPLEKKISYSFDSSELTTTSELAIRYNSHYLRGSTLELMQLESGNPGGPLEDGSISIPKSLPAIVEIKGAAIEILSEDEMTLTYRIVRPFSESDLMSFELR